jgi:DNA-binding beta-propeller fold protein YncE
MSATVYLARYAFGVLRAESTPSTALLVLAKSDNTLAIVDPSSLKVIARMPSGPDPHEVVASTDGKFAYISNYGGGAYNTITVIDLVEQKALPPVDLGPLRGPHGLVFVGGKVWFTAEAAKVIGSYDPEAKKIDWVLGTGVGSGPTVRHLDRRIVPVAAPRWALRGRIGTRLWSPWAEVPRVFDVSPNAKEVWAANAQDGTVSIIDVASKKLTQTLAANVVGANRLKFTPDGKLVFISTLRGSGLAIFDATTRSDVK